MNTQLSKKEEFKSFLGTREMYGEIKAACGGDKEKANVFMSNMVEIYGGDNYLQRCNPNEVAMECLKAASLNLPLSKNLGFATVVAFKNKPTFMIEYKGMIQLAFRSGQIKALNADAVYEGEEVIKDRMSGELRIEGRPTSTKPIGYFGYMRLVNGFEKWEYMTIEQLDAHAKKYSASYGSNSSSWKTNFDAMAKKTLIKKILKYAPMTTEMMKAQAMDVAAEEVKASADAQAMMGASGVVDVQPAQETVIEVEAEVVDAGF